MSQSGLLRVSSGSLPPQVPLMFVTDSGTATPLLNILQILGTTVVAGSTPVSTSAPGSSNIVNVISQRTQAIASTDSTKIGLSAFNSADFTVDANGFVSLSSGEGGSGDTMSVVEDFLGYNVPASNTTGILIAQLMWLQNSGIWSTPRPAPESNHPGIITFFGFGPGNDGATLALAQGDVSGNPPNGCIILGGGAFTLTWIFKMVNLSTAGIRYTFRLGLGDTSLSDQSNGVYLEYSDNINSGNWVLKSAKSSVRTSTNTSTAVTTGWHNLKINVNAAGTSATFVLDNVSLGTIATNVPTLRISPIIDVLRVNGTVASASILFDLMSMSQTFTTPR